MARTVVHYTDTTGFGGAEQALLHLMRRLDPSQWQPVLVYHEAPGNEPLIRGAREIGVGLWEVPRMPDGREGATHVPGFIRSLRAERPDIFHAHLTYPLACKFGLAAAIAARVPGIVATVQLHVEVAMNRSTYLQRRLITTGIDRYIAVSHDVAEHLRQMLRVPQHKISVVHNGIEIAPHTGSDNPELRSYLTHGKARPLILTTARLDPQKGHQYLLEAARSIPDAVFVLAGDGPERAALEAQMHESGLDGRVLFLGYRNDIPDLLGVCDLFVLPSLFEGLPLAVLEAMAAGKPVISSAIGGTDEAVIDGKTGILVPPADPEALAGAIRDVLADPAQARRFAAAGQERVHTRFSSKAMAAKVQQIYETILAKRRT